MSHGLCNRCGFPIAEPAPDHVRCGNAHPRISDLADQMADAVQRQMAAAQRSAWVDRSGWTRQQWIEDARRLMNEPDGAITSLVNGHVMALLDAIDSTETRREPTANSSHSDPALVVETRQEGT